MKDNIQDVDYEVVKSIVNAIEPKTYTFKSDEEKCLCYGFIAQDIEDVYPKCVVKPQNEDEMYTVDYSKFTPLLLAYCKSLQSQIDSLTAKLN